DPRHERRPRSMDRGPRWSYWLSHTCRRDVPQSLALDHRAGRRGSSDQLIAFITYLPFAKCKSTRPPNDGSSCFQKPDLCSTNELDLKISGREVLVVLEHCVRCPSHRGVQERRNGSAVYDAHLACGERLCSTPMDLK